MFDQPSSQTQFSLHHMRRTSICFTLGVALTLLSACSTTQSAQDTTVATVATFPSTTTTTITTVLTTTTTAIVTPQTTTTNKPPATTVAKKKTTVTTQVPQMQLTGTPQEQANQVVAALGKIAGISNYGTRTLQIYDLNQSIASYGITITEDTSRHIYTISANGQSACFIWDYVDIANSDDKGLVRRSCS